MKTIGTRKIVLLSLIVLLSGIYALQLVFTGRSKIQVLQLTDTPDAITITVGDAPEHAQTVSLSCRDGAWYAGEKSYPADENTVSGMLEELKALRLLGTVTRSADGDPERYGLDDGTALTVTASKDGKVLRTVRVGKNTATASQCYIQADGSKTVYLAGSPLHTTFAVTVDSLRSKSVYKLDASAVTEVSVFTAAESHSFTRNPAAARDAKAESSAPEKDSSGAVSVEAPMQVWSFTSSDGSKSALVSDDAKVTSWVNSIASLSASAWLPDDAVPQKSSADVKVTLSTSDGKSVTVSLYEGEPPLDEEEESECTVSCSQTPYLCTVSPYVLMRYRKDVADLVK